MNTFLMWKLFKYNKICYEIYNNNMSNNNNKKMCSLHIQTMKNTTINIKLHSKSTRLNKLDCFLLY